MGRQYSLAESPSPLHLSLSSGWGRKTTRARVV